MYHLVYKPDQFLSTTWLKIILYLDEVSTALGSIGGNDAVEALLHHRQIGAIGYALGELDDFELYDDCLQRYLQSLEDSNEKEYQETQLLVYRAIGLKMDKRYVDMLRQLLQDSRPGFRGVASLALARINGYKEISTLTKAYEESGSPWERIMTVVEFVGIIQSCTRT